MSGLEREKSPDDLRSDARVHRIGGWLIFGALLLSAFLPDRYTLFAFAWPFAMVALATYYARFHRIADLQTGLFGLAALVVIDAYFAIVHLEERRRADRQIERIACEGLYSERAGPELCNDVMIVLRPEPESSELE